MLKRIFKVLLALLVTLIVFDVVGVIVCFVLDVAPLAEKSTALVYAIWFVLGVFCGLFSYFNAGGAIADGGTYWYRKENATEVGTFVIAVAALLLLAMCGIGYAVAWSTNPLGVMFVPDSEPLSITFFAAILATMLFMRNLFKPIKSAPPK